MKTKGNCLIAIDPGREKSGLALLRYDRKVIFHETVVMVDLLPTINILMKKYSVEVFAIGSGTGSKTMQLRLREQYPSIDIKVINEYRTTDEAKKRYWRENPPRGIRRFIPRGMLVPPRPVDDLAAVIIGEKYLSGN
ncbi:pre-16S rRNA-processing nuclease YqgF [Pectinatus frisingensis]|jgi:RNase H-fold protein (predicted Holliday junction resolvase)|uniref:pre-16S rRNA-processing nuclease YqgF n=1 Tax=Pectinatus frisingensis TaxID=865 RepID=UPI0015F57236|nr:pre-16S rRNA-processing nuclease YqgF [Pectinatus frisingensis]